MSVAFESLLFPVSDVEIVAASKVPTVNKPAWVTECVINALSDLAKYGGFTCDSPGLADTGGEP